VREWRQCRRFPASCCELVGGSAKSAVAAVDRSYYGYICADSYSHDYGFEDIFRRQIEALCVKGDVVVGISTSGNSKNICAALQAARAIGACTVAFTGANGGTLASIADIALCIASKDTARIQEGHILCGHMLCDWIELSVCHSHSVESEIEVR